MPANGEERKIEPIGTSRTPSPTVKPKKITADRDVGDAVLKTLALRERVG